MKYKVKKGRKVYMFTEQKRCQYSPKTENAIQKAGYDIYIDEKRLSRSKKKEVIYGK